jgi:hypothetical protein
MMHLPERLLGRYSRALNITVSILLYIIVLICYTLILILFLSPRSLLIPSLIYPDSKGVKPTAIVALIAAVFVGATSALITRSVEQSLWLKLAPRHVKKQLTVGESRRLAQWSVSPLARVTYLLNGRSPFLKISGIMLLATAIVSPVLLSGISQVELTIPQISVQSHQGSTWDGWLDVANSAYNGGNFADIPGVVAAFATLSNLSAPASSICSRPSCSVNAVAAAIQADCTSSYQQVFEQLRTTIANKTYYSKTNPEVSATITGGSPYIYASFSGGFPAGCQSVGTVCTPGEWSVIFGAFVNATDTVSGPWYVNIVDCLLTFGTVRISQDGGNTPSIIAYSYEQSELPGHIDSAIVALHRIYTEYNGSASPFYFSAGSGTGDGADSLFRTPIATLLLGPKANSSAYEVARRIESIFHMATLLAFSRSPFSSDLTITTDTAIPLYDYNQRVLAILLLPLLAVVIGTWGRWRVGGKEHFVGYDPVEIARRGPVFGLPDRIVTQETNDQKRIDGKRVWSYQEALLTDAGLSVTRDRLVVGD